MILLPRVTWQCALTVPVSEQPFRESNWFKEEEWRSGFLYLPRETPASGAAVMPASRLLGVRTSHSPFPIHLLCSLQCPTTMNGPGLPGPSWRSVLTELTARRKAPWSCLPRGNELPHPTPTSAFQSSASTVIHPTVTCVHSVSVLPWHFGCHIVPALL